MVGASTPRDGGRSEDGRGGETGIGVATRGKGGAVAGNYYRRLTGKRRLGAPLGEANCRQHRDTPPLSLSSYVRLLRKSRRLGRDPGRASLTSLIARVTNWTANTIANCPFPQGHTEDETSSILAFSSAESRVEWNPWALEMAEMKKESPLSRKFHRAVCSARTVSVPIFLRLFESPSLSLSPRPLPNYSL